MCSCCLYPSLQRRMLVALHKLHNVETKCVCLSVCLFSLFLSVCFIMLSVRNNYRIKVKIWDCALGCCQDERLQKWQNFSLSMDLNRLNVQSVVFGVHWLLAFWHLSFDMDFVDKGWLWRFDMEWPLSMNSSVQTTPSWFVSMGEFCTRVGKPQFW